MKKIITLIIALASGLIFAENGFIKLKSNHSVGVTISMLEKKLSSKGMTIFSRIKHHEGAKSVGLKLGETELLIFGNPKIGTKLMNCTQNVAIDLPLKFLSWQDKKGQVWLGYNDPAYIGNRHKIKKCAKPQLEKMSKVLARFANSVNIKK